MKRLSLLLLVAWQFAALLPQTTASDVQSCVDVTAAPFRADSSGVLDSTSALNEAILFAHNHTLCVYFPCGVYRVSDTINVSNRWPGGYPAAFYQPGYTPSVLKGSTLCGTGHRPLILLSPTSKGYADTRRPKYVVHIWTEARGAVTPTHPYQPQPNANIDNSFTGIDIRIGQGNPGAVGLRHRCAQGSTVQDVTIFAAEGLTGLEGGAGSGAAHVNVRVEGGLWGLDLRQTQPGPTVVGATLIGQRCSAILYQGMEVLTAVGVNISVPSFALRPAILIGVFPYVGSRSQSQSQDVCVPPVEHNPQPSTAGISGQLNLIDSVIDFEQQQQRVEQEPATACVAISTNRSIYLENVYIRACDTAVAFTWGSTGRRMGLAPDLPLFAHGGGSGYVGAVAKPVICPLDTASASPSWCRVRLVAQGVTPPPVPAGSAVYEYQTPLYIDGKRQTDSVRSVTTMPGAQGPPVDLLTRHVWNSSSFPSFEDPGVVNARSFGAVGDGVTDDYEALTRALSSAAAAVYLPKGLYRVSRTLILRQGTALIGAGKHLSILMPMSSGLTRTHTHTRTRTRTRTRTQGEQDQNLDVAWMPVLHVTGQDDTHGDEYQAAAAWGSEQNSRTAASQAPQTNSSLGVTVLYDIAVVTWDHLSDTYALHWSATDSAGVFRQVHAFRHSECQFYRFSSAPACHRNVSLAHAVNVISGSGRFYGYYIMGGYRVPQSPHYRNLLLQHAHDVRIYHLNAEHGRGDAETEMRWCTNVSVFGSKSEGNFAVLWVRDSSDIRWYGMGGSACALPLNATYPQGYSQYPPSLFRVERTSGFLLTNPIDQAAAPSPPSTFDRFYGEGFDASVWSTLVRCMDNTTATITSSSTGSNSAFLRRTHEGSLLPCPVFLYTRPLDRAVLYCDGLCADTLQEAE